MISYCGDRQFWPIGEFCLVLYLSVLRKHLVIAQGVFSALRSSVHFSLLFIDRHLSSTFTGMDRNGHHY